MGKNSRRNKARRLKAELAAREATTIASPNVKNSKIVNSNNTTIIALPPAPTTLLNDVIPSAESIVDVRYINGIEVKVSISLPQGKTYGKQDVFRAANGIDYMLIRPVEFKSDIRSGVNNSSMLPLVSEQDIYGFTLHDIRKPFIPQKSLDANNLYVNRPEVSLEELNDFFSGMNLVPLGNYAEAYQPLSSNSAHNGASCLAELLMGNSY